MSLSVELSETILDDQPAARPSSSTSTHVYSFCRNAGTLTISPFSSTAIPPFNMLPDDVTFASSCSGETNARRWSLVSDPVELGLSGSMRGWGESFEGPAMALRFVVMVRESNLVLEPSSSGFSAVQRGLRR